MLGEKSFCAPKLSKQLSQFQTGILTTIFDTLSPQIFKINQFVCRNKT